MNLFNEPQKAIYEFIRVTKKDGIVVWGDEGFSPNLVINRRKRFITKVNPGFLKARPAIPNGLACVKEYEVYNGLAYLVVGEKS